MTKQTETLKLALEALELLAYAEQTYAAIDYADNAIATIKAALAQPEQEPFEDLAPELFVVAQTSPADDGFSDTIDRIETWLREHFSTPPKREWVELTFAELCECENDNLYKFARAILAKSKEKNT